jgi:predicted enzyme related to lactoylglutathione lyase
MGTKTVKYNKQSIEKLPNDKPVLYRIKTESGRMNYVGVAQKGWVRERISEHMGKIPGAKVQIEQFSNITDAQKKEINVIRRTQAKYNKQGK